MAGEKWLAVNESMQRIFQKLFSLLMPHFQLVRAGGPRVGRERHFNTRRYLGREYTTLPRPFYFSRF